MALTLNTFAHVVIIGIFVGIFAWNLLNYREGLTDEDTTDEDTIVEDTTGEDTTGEDTTDKPKRKLTKKEEIAEKKKAAKERKKAAKDRKYAEKAEAEMVDRLK